MKNFKDLDDLIHSGAKEIVLDCDIALGDGEDEDYLEGIRLDVDDLTIDGAGHTIDARRKALIFYNTSSVTLKNVTLKNGLRAVYNFRGNLNLSNSVLLENASEITGGAIYNYWGNVSISGSRLLRNYSGCHGGAIFNFNGEVNVSGSEFCRNFAESDGGAIFNGSRLNITGCFFNANVSKGSGGAIYDNRGEINIGDSRFLANSSQGTFGGGAIHKNRGILNISKSDLSDNSAKGSGGAIFAIDCELSLEGSKISGNVSSGASVYTKIMQNLVIDACEFENNRPDDVFR